MKEDERKIATSRLSHAAKEAMKEWKKKTGIKAIVPKTDNQKREQSRYLRRVRQRNYEEMKTISHGPASDVRHIKLEE